MTTQTKCPTGCGRVVQPGHLMCKTCWFEVPHDLRKDVNRTWRAYSKGSPLNKGFAALREKRVAYQAARDAALASIR